MPPPPPVRNSVPTLPVYISRSFEKPFFCFFVADDPLLSYSLKLILTRVYAPCTYNFPFLRFYWKLGRKCRASNRVCCWTQGQPIWTVRVRYGLHRICRSLCCPRSCPRNRCSNSIVSLRRSFPACKTLSITRRLLNRRRILRKLAGKCPTVGTPPV